MGYGSLTGEALRNGDGFAVLKAEFAGAGAAAAVEVDAAGCC